MTERWRKKLEGIDKQGPSDDVFERAKQGPMHRDEALPGPRMSARVVTIVAAFLVFALAISVFAIPALRMGNQAAGEGSVLVPLWPAQTFDQLEQLQANPPSWALDPQQVAEHFTREVMGWSTPWAAEAACDLPAYASSSPSYSSPPVTGGGLYAFYVGCPSIVRWGVSGEPSYPYPTNSAGPSQDGSFRTYSVFSCGGDICDQIDPPGEFVQVYQPLEQGEGQIWAVLQAQGQATLSVAPGQIVHDGSSVSAGFVTGRGLVPTLGYGSCGQSAASSASSSPAGSDGAGIQSDVHLTGDCEGEQPGYVWAATSNVSLADAGDGIVDPFAGGRPALASITAAPVTMIFPASTGETTAPTSPTPEKSVSPTIGPSQWTTFDGGLGFTMELPADWGTTTITDEIVVNAPGGDPYIQINRVDAAPRDDSSFPLDFADYEGDNQPHFYGDGQTFIIQWFTGTADPLTPEQSAVVERIVESIRFEPWTVGETRNTFTAIGQALRSATAEWITYRGENYLSYLGGEGDGGRIAYGPAPRCLPGGPQPLLEVRESGVAAITCQDGQSGQWRFDSGKADSTNDQRFAEPLPKHRAILSWDGFLLVDLSSTIS